MTTKFVKKDEVTEEIIRQAAETIKNGGLVAFPTETVYGLGANGLNDAAVSAVYSAKGRPADNPLILHISNLNMLKLIAKDISPVAMVLINVFWPGPLTLVFKKTGLVSDVISRGLDTVAVRFPAHELAQKLIAAADTPIAAPSANISGRPSPTEALHVLEDMDGKIPWILDGGSCDIGVESTVVDVTGDYPVILRPGKITFEDIKKLFPATQYDEHLVAEHGEIVAPRSPGMKYKHYAPKGEIQILSGELYDIQQYIDKHSTKMSAVLTFNQYPIKHKRIYSLGSINRPEEGCSKLFSYLRTFDTLEIDKIFAVMPEKRGVGFALYNRLFKAAGGKVINL